MAFIVSETRNNARQIFESFHLSWKSLYFIFQRLEYYHCIPEHPEQIFFDNYNQALSPNEYYRFYTTGEYPLNVSRAPEVPKAEKLPDELGNKTDIQNAQNVYNAKN